MPFHRAFRHGEQAGLDRPSLRCALGSLPREERGLREGKRGPFDCDRAASLARAFLGAISDHAAFGERACACSAKRNDIER